MPKIKIGSSSSRNIKTNFLPLSTSIEETTSTNNFPIEIESIVDIKNTAGIRLGDCAFISNDGNLVNFEGDETENSYKVISINHKDEVQTRWDVNFSEEKFLSGKLKSTIHRIVFSSNLTFVVVVSIITKKKYKGQSDSNKVEYSITLYKLPRGVNCHNGEDICVTPAKQHCEFVGRHYVEATIHPYEVALSESNILSIGFYQNRYLLTEHYKINPHSTQESCIKLVGNHRVMYRTYILNFRYSHIGDILICSSYMMTTCFINISQYASDNNISDGGGGGVSGQLSKLMTIYPGRNCFIVLYDTKEYLVCNGLMDHKLIQNENGFFIKVSEVTRRKNGTLLFKKMFCLDTKPFRELKIHGADSCYDRALIVCEGRRYESYDIIDVFRKTIVYRMDGEYNRIHSISCHYAQMGFSCNEIFFMCSNRAGRSFMKCFQLQNKFPTLLGLTRNVLLRTYSLDEFKKMNLSRVCQSILHLPIVKVID